jgi:hypothetical protein
MTDAVETVGRYQLKLIERHTTHANDAIMPSSFFAGVELDDQDNSSTTIVAYMAGGASADITAQVLAASTLLQDSLQGSRGAMPEGFHPRTQK